MRLSLSTSAAAGAKGSRGGAERGPARRRQGSADEAVGARTRRAGAVDLTGSSVIAVSALARFGPAKGVLPADYPGSSRQD